MILYMSGFGGNRLVFNPNGIINVLFTDVGIYELDPMVRVAEAVRPFPTGSGQ